MKIVISSKSYYPLLGGSIVFASMLGKAFSRAGHEVIIITRTPGSCDNSTLPILRNSSFKELINLATSTDLVLQIDASWRDIIPFLARGVLWFPTVHRGKPAYSGLGIKQSLRLALESLGYRTGNTIGVADYVTKSWGLNTEPIPNPYDDEVFHPPDPSIERDVDVLFVGRVTRDKGVFLLLEALDALKKNVRLKRVAFVGIGPALEELQRDAKRFQDDFEILFPGLVDSYGVADWMKRSRVLAFPTTPDWLEASPLTPLEATACGCKVVAADIGGTRENVSPSHWMVKSGDVTALYKGLLAALEDPANKIDEPTLNFLNIRSLQNIATRYLERFQAAFESGVH